jgi:hypothetical protein
LQRATASRAQLAVRPCLPCRTALLAKPRYPACHATLLAGFSLQKNGSFIQTVFI